MRLLSSYFKNYRIDKIDYLVRAERQAARGCFYLIAKFWLAFIVMGIAANLFYSILPLNLITQLSDNGLIALFYMGITLCVITLPTIIAINTLDQIWHKKEKKEFDKHEISLRDLLNTYQQSNALNSYNKQIIMRMLSREGDLNETFKSFSSKELALIEDCILYHFEKSGVLNSHAKGTNIMIMAMIVLFLLIMAPLMEFTQHIIHEYMPALKNSIAVIFPFFGIAIFAMWRASSRVEAAWDRIGPHGRNAARAIIIYWPLSIFILITAYGLSEPFTQFIAHQ